MTQTTAGAIRTAMKAIETQLLGHMNLDPKNPNPTGKLATLKHLFIGSRDLQSPNDLLPSAMIIPKSGKLEQYATAGYQGKYLLTLQLEVQIGAPKLMSKTVNAYANNVLYDDDGNGCVPLFENFMYCLIYSGSTPSADNFTPHLGLPLKSMVGQDFRFVDDGNFAYIVSNVTIEYMVTYSDISGS